MDTRTGLWRMTPAVGPRRVGVGFAAAVAAMTPREHDGRSVRLVLMTVAKERTIRVVAAAIVQLGSGARVSTALPKTRARSVLPGGGVEPLVSDRTVQRALPRDTAPKKVGRQLARMVVLRGGMGTNQAALPKIADVRSAKRGGGALHSPRTRACARAVDTAQ